MIVDIGVAPNTSCRPSNSRRAGQSFRVSVSVASYVPPPSKRSAHQDGAWRRTVEWASGSFRILRRVRRRGRASSPTTSCPRAWHHFGYWCLHNRVFSFHSRPESGRTHDSRAGYPHRCVFDHRSVERLDMPVCWGKRPARRRFANRAEQQCAAGAKAHGDDGLTGPSLSVELPSVRITASQGAHEFEWQQVERIIGRRYLVGNCTSA